MDILPEGTLVVAEVVRHEHFGVFVRLLSPAQGTEGLIEVPHLYDERPIRSFADYPPIGSRVEAVVVPYRPYTPVRLSALRRDVDPVLRGEKPQWLSGPTVSGGPEMTGIDRLGRSLLHYAASENEVADVEELLDAGSDPNLGDEKGLTPLHFAAARGSVEAARVLLDHAAEVDKADYWGNTALARAVISSRGMGESVGEMIALLRERGADPSKANKHGETPVGEARHIADYDIAQFFADLP